MLLIKITDTSTPHTYPSPTPIMKSPHGQKKKSHTKDLDIKKDTNAYRSRGMAQHVEISGILSNKHGSSKSLDSPMGYSQVGFLCNLKDYRSCVGRYGPGMISTAQRERRSAYELVK